MTAVSTKQFRALLGNLDHKKDVYLHTGQYDQGVNARFLTNKAQADWLTEFHPELVPGPDPSGNLPSEKSIATVFEANYVLPDFRHEYLQWLKYQDV